MMRKITFFLTLLLLVSALSSCSSIYVSTPEVTGDYTMEVDPNEEYFTSGAAVNRNDSNGRIYNDYWIYLEKQKYQQYRTTLSNGEEQWSTKQIKRWVKLNTQTGEVSSLCLIPSCTHSLGSDCPMIVTDGMALIQGLIDDWFVFSYYHDPGMNADSLGYIPESYIYNLQTGELIKLLEYDLSGTVISKASTWCFFEDEIYFVKDVFDYSDSGYIPGKDMPDYFIPETRSYLCMFDINTKKISDVMEIPNEYEISAITNRRFFFIDDKKEIYSCDRNVKELTKEEVLDFSPQEFCGVYAYNFSNIEGGELLVYNIRTDTKSVIDTEYTYRQAIATNDGIIMTTFSDSNEGYSEITKRRSEFKNDAEMLKERARYRYESTALVYMLSFDGSGRSLIYEKDRIIITAYLKSDKYLCALQTGVDPDNGYQAFALPNNGRVLIDIETGEITPVPYLELVYPDGYRASE